MKKILAFGIGGLLIVIGVIALFGAVEVWRSGGDVATVAQSFLVPASLFAVGGFVIWMGLNIGPR